MQQVRIPLKQRPSMRRMKQLTTLRMGTPAARAKIARVILDRRDRGMTWTAIARDFDVPAEDVRAFMRAFLSETVAVAKARLVKKGGADGR